MLAEGDGTIRSKESEAEESNAKVCRVFLHVIAARYFTRYGRNQVVRKLMREDGDECDGIINEGGIVGDHDGISVHAVGAERKTALIRH